MAGLELLFNCVSNSLTCSQDALICFVHWEIVKSGYKCLGTGDEPKDGEKKSELLPPGWNESKDLYALRYRSSDDKSNLLLKAFTVDSTLIFNLMDSKTEKVTDLTLNISEYVEEANLQTFESVFKNTDELITKLKSSLLPTEKEERQGKTEKKTENERASHLRDPLSDPLLIPTRGPPGVQRRTFWGILAGGMIVDPLRAGFPRSGFDPSSGIPGVLPPGAVPPGARFDPFGPVGRHRPGPDPDHMPPPYDDMFM
uniref:Proteasome inhibitor PI31 subunit n=1 Tax=Cyprinus carpio TaxID=7962 RepID=A0A8C1QGC2_CYPCA